MSKTRIIFNLIFLVLLSAGFVLAGLSGTKNYEMLYMGIAFGVFSVFLLADLVRGKSGPATKFMNALNMKK